LYEKLLKTVTNLGSPQVILVGDFMLDIYTFGDAERISPEAPVPVLKVRDIKTRCGGAASVAVDLATLGAKVFCIGIVGDDENAKILKQLLSNAGVDTAGIVTADERPTICKHRLIGLAQHRHQQQLFRIDSESTEPVTEQQAEKLISLFKEKIQSADVVCLQDYNKGLLTEGFCRSLMKQTKNAGKKIVVDPSSTADYSKYKGASVITPNRQETSIAVGFELKNESDYQKAAGQLAEKLNLDAVIITLDKEGSYLKTKDTSELIPTRPRNVYDVTGAGDMVLATVAVALATGCDYKTAVQLANITGGIEVEKFGVATVTIEEIINEIIAQNRGKSGKLRTIESLTAELSLRRKQNETIVFTNGCFDVLHIGHIEYLKFCRSNGDVVVVGLNSDKSVRMIKDSDRPINNQYDRAAVLAALETVDYIIMFDEADPLSLIKQIRPDVLIKGKDWEQKGVVGAECVKSYGGKVLLAPLVEGKSTTATIEKMKSLCEEN